MPFGLVFLFFFVIPLILVVIVSFWDYNDYEMLPSFTTRSYTETFEGCLAQFPDLCTILKTYVSTAKFCFIVWLSTLVIGFTVAYFLAFHVRTVTMQMVLFLVCTIPFWTSNVIRMISWIPLLGRNGLVNLALSAPTSSTSRSNGCSIRRSRSASPSPTSSPSSWWCRSSTR